MASRKERNKEDGEEVIGEEKGEEGGRKAAT